MAPVLLATWFTVRELHARLRLNAITWPVPGAMPSTAMLEAESEAGITALSAVTVGWTRALPSQGCRRASSMQGGGNWRTVRRIGSGS